MQQIFPELVTHCSDEYLGVNYQGFSIIAIKAIQELSDENEELRQKIKAQDEEIDRLKSLKRRIERLESELLR